MSKARTWFTVSGILITAVLFFFALRFCTQLPEETVHKIALISPVHARELGEAMRLGADAAAKEFGVELVYIGLKQQDGAAQQRKAVEQALKNDVAAVLIDPADNEILEVIGELSAAKQAPVILLNDERTAKGVMAAISVDNLQAGRKAGEAMAGLLGGSGGVAVIGSELDDPDLAAREPDCVRPLPVIRASGSPIGPYAEALMMHAAGGDADAGPFCRRRDYCAGGSGFAGSCEGGTAPGYCRDAQDCDLWE